MKLNVRPNFLIDSALHEKLKKEASERGMKLSELFRERLREGGRLEVVEERLRGVEKKFMARKE